MFFIISTTDQMTVCNVTGVTQSDKPAESMHLKIKVIEIGYKDM